MKQIFKYKKEMKELILNLEEKHLVRMIFRDLDNVGVPGHDDFFKHICIDFHTFDRIKKKYGINPRRK